MKRKLLTLTAFIVGITTYSQNVNIPNATFKSYLVNNGAININGDTEISVAEAQAFGGTINVNNKGISDLTGIEAFTNFITLTCYGNNLTYLDLSSCSNLRNLNCTNNNQLEHLNIATGNNRLLYQVNANNNASLLCIQLDNGYSLTNNQNILWTKDSHTDYSYSDCRSQNIYVNVNATGNSDGTSWADAYTTLSDGLADSSQNDVIWVAKGTYNPNNNIDPLLITAKGAKIMGGFQGNENTLTDRDVSKIYTDNATIITGDFNNDDIAGDFNANRTDNATKLLKLAAHNVTLDGFILQNAHTSASSPIIEVGTNITNFSLKNIFIRENYSNGILLDWRTFSGNVIVENVAIKNNSTNNGILLVQHNNTNTSELTTNWANILLADNTYNADWGAIWFRRGTSSNTGRNVKHYVSNATFINNSNQHASIRNLINVSGDGWHHLEILNSIFWNNLYNTNTVSDNDLFNTKKNEGNNQTVVVKNVIGNISSIVTTGVYSETNVNNTAADLFLDANYKPTSNSSVVIDQGDNTLYNTSLFNNFDLQGNDRFYNTTIDLGAFEYEGTLSANNIQKDKSVHIFPNPVDNELHINANSPIKSYAIYNITGDLVKENHELSENIINLSYLSSGVYILSINTEKGIAHQKIMKK
ncbi:T9SS type A sorting domain-containing protein [Wenyingzhuangia marina]|uniref:Por secretion system C-terminal sorting domain-containing protein n=1 Tax=Wenyingzhuangia marina TaxID=1195760 RepID=A0A1M5U0E0_9FLAO|nr:T9SS type A sorting domain-containing protein [Wenyingzhuangia marina]GGF70167.1 hypothetical protein GCM10011397_11360 [Wenyingzhuangia marina]SHH56502.1 Por secretion system C-terminal sorting domain-containing protein [Wenyingzhuangia marina]